MNSLNLGQAVTTIINEPLVLGKNSKAPEFLRVSETVIKNYKLEKTLIPARHLLSLYVLAVERLPPDHKTLTEFERTLNSSIHDVVKHYGDIKARCKTLRDYMIHELREKAIKAASKLPVREEVKAYRHMIPQKADKPIALSA